jgi:hypothetical protein
MQDDSYKNITINIDSQLIEDYVREYKIKFENFEKS